MKLIPHEHVDSSSLKSPKPFQSARIQWITITITNYKLYNYNACMR